MYLLYIMSTEFSDPGTYIHIHHTRMYLRGVWMFFIFSLRIVLGRRAL